MVTAEPEVPKGGAVRAQLVGGHRLWREALFSQQLAHQLEGRAAVPPALKQHVEDLAFMVDRAPEIHPPSGDPDDYLIEVSAAARPGDEVGYAKRSSTRGSARVNPETPTADRKAFRVSRASHIKHSTRRSRSRRMVNARSLPNCKPR